jgi:YD repeat-containing protein
VAQFLDRRQYGQIQCITDSVDSGRTVKYTYDVLRRLNTAVTNGSVAYPQWGLAERYDRYGNRPTQTVTAGNGPPSSVIIDPNTNQISGFTYDANGNLIGEPAPNLTNFTYDAEDRLVSYQGPTANAAYIYDDNRLRVRKCLPNCTSPTSSTAYIFSGTKVIAE